MPGKFVIGLSHAKNGTNKATVIFSAANAAIASGKSTIVFLSLEGVRLSQRVYASKIHDEGFTPLTDLMTNFVEAGGQILVCASCLNKRGLDKNALIPSALIAESGGLTGLIGVGDCCSCETALPSISDTELPVRESVSGTAIVREKHPAAGLCDVTERKRAAGTQHLLLAELDHRVNNILASIQAIAAQSLNTAVSPAEFVDSFNGRLLALGRVYRLLTLSSWKGADLVTLVNGQLADREGNAGTRVSCSGPSVLLEPQAAIDLGLVLHELESNARKHGSLSQPEGRLTAKWFLTASKGRPELRLEWAESGGPPVAAPAKRGFGITFIEHSLSRRQGAEARLGFEPAGVTCKISLPLPQWEARSS